MQSVRNGTGKGTAPGTSRWMFSSEVDPTVAQTLFPRRSRNPRTLDCAGTNMRWPALK
jgi:hypothetical protein